MIEFKNKTVWITGASSGIGKALAVNLSTLGANIVLSSRKKEELEVIKGYKAVINSRKIGIDLRALITVISESSSNYEKIINFEHYESQS